MLLVIYSSLAWIPDLDYTDILMMMIFYRLSFSPFCLSENIGKMNRRIYQSITYLIYKSMDMTIADIMADIITRNLSVDEIGERYRLNHAIVMQAACEQVSVERYACKLLAYRTRLKLTS